MEKIKARSGRGPTLLRGGSWSDPQGSARSANRGKVSPDIRYNLIGFRVRADA